jgi:hypothetical protein
LYFAKHLRVTQGKVPIEAVEQKRDYYLQIIQKVQQLNDFFLTTA